MVAPSRVIGAPARPWRATKPRRSHARETGAANAAPPPVAGEPPTLRRGGGRAKPHGGGGEGSPARAPTTWSGALEGSRRRREGHPPPFRLQAHSHTLAERALAGV